MAETRDLLCARNPERLELIERAGALLIPANALSCERGEFPAGALGVRTPSGDGGGGQQQQEQRKQEAGGGGGGGSDGGRLPPGTFLTANLQKRSALAFIALLMTVEAGDRERQGVSMNYTVIPKAVRIARAEVAEKLVAAAKRLPPDELAHVVIEVLPGFITAAMPMPLAKIASGEVEGAMLACSEDMYGGAAVNGVPSVVPAALAAVTAVLPPNVVLVQAEHLQLAALAAFLGSMNAAMTVMTGLFALFYFIHRPNLLEWVVISGGVWFEFWVHFGNGRLAFLVLEAGVGPAPGGPGGGVVPVTTVVAYVHGAHPSVPAGFPSRPALIAAFAAAGVNLPTTRGTNWALALVPGQGAPPAVGGAGGLLGRGGGGGGGGGPGGGGGGGGGVPPGGGGGGGGGGAGRRRSGGGDDVNLALGDGVDSDEDEYDSAEEEDAVVEEEDDGGI